MVQRREHRAYCWVLLVAVSIGALALYAKYIALGLQVELARDQVEIFQGMVADRRDSDIVSREAGVRYIVNYYPSGTKQSRGTLLDFIVEAARASAIRELQR